MSPLQQDIQRAGGNADGQLQRQTEAPSSADTTQAAGTTIADSDLSALPEASELRCVEGTVVSPDDLRYFELGKKLEEGSLATLNDFLGRLLTLNVALIGGGFAAAKGDVIPMWSAIPVVICLMTSLLICIAGIMPRRRAIDFSDHQDVAQQFREAVNWKNRTQLVSVCVFAVAMLMAVTGFVCKAVLTHG